ncbi:hypothetical protein [Roseococcus sp.]|uniref:hypothetical protein n=1 Tax=Roseococcus sp. TaxID=2109646 RepID=UPI003BABA0C6
MRRWPAWVTAWVVTAGLAAILGLAMALTPVTCNILGNCPWTSGLGLFLLGSPVVAICLLAALTLSLRALWRRRRP